MAVVYERLKREDGSTQGLGASVECSDEEARALVAAGTHYDPSGVAVQAVEKPAKRGKSVVVDEDLGDVNDGTDSVA
jgi:hypothetical protein